MIIHFFNPPRYMKLVELVTNDNTAINIIKKVEHFLTKTLGKTVVRCNDTPGFIANRIGCFLMEITLRKTIEHKLDIESVDHIFNKYLGLPSTGIFGLYDLIGIDVMRLISTSLAEALGKNDRFSQVYSLLPLIQKMIDDGYIGRKGKGGFYRITDTKDKEVMDLQSMTYRTLSTDTENFSDISNILARKDNTGAAFREIIEEFGSYIMSLIPSVTSSSADIDIAMKLGYGFKYGPFELFSKYIPHKYCKKNSI